MKADMRHAQLEIKPSARQKWEYKTGKMDADADMTQYGGEGWELVSVIQTASDPGTVTAYFKRAM